MRHWCINNWQVQITSVCIIHSVYAHYLYISAMCYYQENKADIARTWLVRVSSSRAHDPIVYAPSSTNQNALRPPVDLSAQLVLANEVFRFSCATRVLPLKSVKFCCQLSWKENLEMSNEWSHGLFSCFEDCSTCELMRSSRQTDLATDFFSFFFFFLFFSRRHPYMVLSMLCVR